MTSAIRLPFVSALGGIAVTLAACGTTAEKPTPPTPAVIPAASQQLLDDVRILSADDMEGRDTGSPGGERARAYIVGRLEAMGIAAPPVGRLQPFEAEVPSPSGLVRYKGTNIIGLIPGTRATDRYIVVTAHYDHVGVSNGLIYNGADDNASGVATMLELTRRLKAQAPEHSVLIVAFDGEERGLIGARHFVQAPPVPLSSIALNINFDMTSRAETDNHLWVSGTYQNPAFRPILDTVAPNGAISLAFGHDTPQDTGSDNWIDASDHGPFFKAGLPFIYMGVVDHPDYHRPSDDFDKITPSAFISSTELAIAAFRALDRSLDR